ncbi:hypothetical protein [Mesorhizobium sp. B2-9-1]|uniref:hypothetical protein n=1 Tax=Mesorhizobium sp. B2-9-1 TaxID=2589898 RepID=UPI0015E34518|nr:hypothetical protein [Mesorhizobium sp. B2-9-1]
MFLIGWRKDTQLKVVNNGASFVASFPDTGILKVAVVLGAGFSIHFREISAGDWLKPPNLVILWRSKERSDAAQTIESMP